MNAKVNQVALNMSDQYTYRVIWSEEDVKYVGLCSEFPSLSCLDKSENAALNGIRQLVSDTAEELKFQHDPIPIPLKK